METVSAGNAAGAGVVGAGADFVVSLMVAAALAELIGEMLMNSTSTILIGTRRS
jgi:hypothetical protein